MDKKNISEQQSARPSHLTRWLPTPGNVIFTLLVAAFLVMTQNVWAFPLRAPATTSTNTISYQGRLADAAGNPLSGQYNMQFRLYNMATGGSPLWEEDWTGNNSVQVSDGLFNVMLGSVDNTLAGIIASHNELYLGITIGSEGEISPRVQLGSVPFSMQALTVPDGSVTTEKIADGAVTADKLNAPIFSLLGHKTCRGCGTPVEQSTTLWTPVKGQDTNDVIEVTVTTQGGPIFAQMTAGFETDASIAHFCGLRVWQNNNVVRFVHFNGTRAPSVGFSCSGTWLFPDLPSGTYTFQVDGHVGSSQVTWIRERQIVVYEFPPTQ